MNTRTLIEKLVEALLCSAPFDVEQSKGAILAAREWLAAPEGDVLQAALAEPSTHRATGWVAPVDRYAVPVLFNPYTGNPRDVRDVSSDPQGTLIVPPGKVEMLAAKPHPAPSKPAPLPELTDAQIRAEFGKLYPRDLDILSLAENNRDYAVESIGARHHWTAFLSGARAILAAARGNANGK